MLISYLDNETQKMIIGQETEYEKAMEKLDKYYGDTHKLVQACIAEIKSLPQV